MATERHILCVGLNPLDIPPPLPPGVVPEMIAKVDNIIKTDLARAGRNGFTCTLHYFNWHDHDAGAAAVQKVLAEGEGKWEAVMFGAGIRTHKDPVLLEKALDAVRKAIGTEVPILFNDGPDRHSWVLERHFGVKFEKE